MAYTTINKPSDYFNTKLYTGNGTSQTLDMDNLGMLWMKNRTETSNHVLFDSVRGGYYISAPGPELRPNGTTAGSGSDITSAYGITFGSSSSTIGSDGGGYNYNQNGKSYVGWQWRANGAGSTNTDGSINSTVSVNTTAGFSIVKVSKPAASVATIGHGLGVTPKFIIGKDLDGVDNWTCYNEALGNGKAIYLNATNAESTASTFWNSTSPTSSVFTIGSDNTWNSPSIVFYCFADVQGYSKFGSYTGNGSTDGTFVYTGFKPAWLMIKRTDDANSWIIMDNKRTTFNPMGEELKAEVSDAGNVATRWDQLSNGFKLRNAGAAVNASGGTYIYMAFAEAPLVGTNNVPATAR